MSAQLLKICLPALLLLSACAVKTGGLPGDPAHLKVEPKLFCPGDEVTVSWTKPSLLIARDKVVGLKRLREMA